MPKYKVVVTVGPPGDDHHYEVYNVEAVDEEEALFIVEGLLGFRVPRENMWVAEVVGRVE